MGAVDVVLPVVRAMSAELPRGGLRLPDMAEIAHLSPYHFIRTFRRGTGLSPAAFQSALRLAEAKRRLIETDQPVTDVCFDLGYASLGTFVARFAAAVGLAPMRYRRFVAAFEAPRGDRLAEILAPPAASALASVSGVLAGDPATGGPAADGPVFVGLFPQYLPRGLPVAGTARLGPGPFALGPVADGTYAVLAAGCPADAGLGPALLNGRGLRVAGAAGVRVTAGRSRPVHLALRPPRPTDPPLLVGLPLLLSRATARWEKRGAARTG